MDDYVIGALIIYLDIIILFLRILEMLGKKKDWLNVKIKQLIFNFWKSKTVYHILIQNCNKSSS